ncbi:unnamed protein product [Prorocentrum cordatum]|uniref:Cellulase n=1 Tax=Prorocentrum cordatum TaxID=2364126 RepID=A0ABN9QX03_9DINO|nr:unnamed protein product [Polarella glacialis]
MAQDDDARGAPRQGAALRLVRGGAQRLASGQAISYKRSMVCSWMSAETALAASMWTQCPDSTEWRDTWPPPWSAELAAAASMAAMPGVPPGGGAASTDCWQ